MSLNQYTPGLMDDALLDLRAAVWGADHPHTTPGFFKWLFQETPTGPGTGVVSERDGRVVGFAGIANRLARMGDTTLRVAHGLEFMVDPGLGGMLSGRVGVQVLNRHVEVAQEIGSDFNLNYPNDNSHRMLISKRVKYQPVFAPDLYACALGPPKVEEKGAGVRAALAIGGLAGGAYAAARSIGAGSTVEIEKVTRFDDRFDAHWDRLSADGRLRFFRDGETLRWRYDDNPIYSYTTFAAVRAGEILGYVVASERTISGIEATLICDLSVAGGDRSVTLALIAQLKRHARAVGTRLIVGQAVASDPLVLLLRRTGFLRVPPKLNPKPFRMIGIAYTKTGELGLDASNWAFSWGDMDVV